MRTTNSRVPYPVTAAIRHDLRRAIRDELGKLGIDGNTGGGGGGGLLELPPGTVMQVEWDNGWPARPTPRPDLRVVWVGGPFYPPGALPGDRYRPTAG